MGRRAGIRHVILVRRERVKINGELPQLSLNRWPPPLYKDDRDPSRGSVIIHNEFAAWHLKCSESVVAQPSRRERELTHASGHVVWPQGYARYTGPRGGAYFDTDSSPRIFRARLCPSHTTHH